MVRTYPPARERLRPTAGAVLLGLIGFGAMLSGCREKQPAEGEASNSVQVEHVRNGHTVKLKPDDKLVYAGIRAPFEHEPLFAEAKKRNAELVEGKEVRLRFDEAQRDRDDRLSAYVFTGDQFVNETLVKEGLAWVRLTSESRRFAAELLAAQAEARRARRGLWRLAPPATADRYLADSKYGNFHTPDCAECEKIKPERRVELKTRLEALDQGFAPCATCAP